MNRPSNPCSRCIPPFRAVAFLLAVLTIPAGCNSRYGTFNTVFFEGHVRCMCDSTAVPGALILVKNLSLVSPATQLYTDSTGAFSYSVTWPTRNWEPLNIQVTVADCDGWENGLFLARDTLLYHENSEGESRVDFHIDFYVEMVR